MLFSCKYFELNQVELCRIVQKPASPSPNAREFRALVLPYKAIKQSQQPLDLDPEKE